MSQAEARASSVVPFQGILTRLLESSSERPSSRAFVIHALCSRRGLATHSTRGHRWMDATFSTEVLKMTCESKQEADRRGGTCLLG